MIAKGVQYNISQDYDKQKQIERVSRNLGKLSYKGRQILKDEFDNHYMIIISKEGLRLVRDEIFVPVNDWEKECCANRGDNFYE